ncbi:endonuclease/exonuclease/phosphatase family protein, partial [Trifolium medium]|nr:endonuclease/exonuclease/phosphatase family protein [Trifolium medium]
MKLALKEWHASHTQNVPSRIESLKVRLAALDSKGEDLVLSDEEVQELHEITSDIH